MTKKNLTEIFCEEVKESAIELIQQVVSIHKNYPSTFEDINVIQQYKLAITAAKRLPHNILSKRERESVDYLNSINLQPAH